MDEIKILTTPEDFDPPSEPEPEPEDEAPGLRAPAPSFDELRWQLSQ